MGRHLGLGITDGGSDELGFSPVAFGFEGGEASGLVKLAGRPLMASQVGPDTIDQ
jgi:hypothetical protein